VAINAIVAAVTGLMMSVTGRKSILGAGGTGAGVAGQAQTITGSRVFAGMWFMAVHASHSGGPLSAAQERP